MRDVLIKYRIVEFANAMVPISTLIFAKQRDAQSLCPREVYVVNILIYRRATLWRPGSCAVMRDALVKYGAMEYVPNTEQREL